MKWLLFLLSISLFVIQPSGYIQDNRAAAGVSGNTQVDNNSQPVTSGLSNIQGLENSHTSAMPENDDSSRNTPVKELTLQQYITPDEQAVKTLADSLGDLEDVYSAASRWIYVSDEKLNRTTDKWLTPREFLIDSPAYPANPLQGKTVSDCEEKANTLVSLIRAKGTRPEDVRVVLGEVSFNNVKTGHAWVELFNDENWLALDPSWGPYWNEESGKLVNRKAVPFDYYASHDYPVIQVWVYYNDIYYLDCKNNSGTFPDSWNITPTT
jgi:hypothetical protein